MMMCPLFGLEEPKSDNISPTFLLTAVGFQSMVLPTAISMLRVLIGSLTVFLLTVSSFVLVLRTFISCFLTAFWIWMRRISAMNLMKNLPLALSESPVLERDPRYRS